ncbi:MAG TPA: hypothetical protein PKW06_07110 [Cyclobacteriaceae bacterium]|nr:hypothetical protein [Cyclobacteriaceae bacterium]HOO09689.1 hypothetical protein [Cyclobacteriaceae bacterium]
MEQVPAFSNCGRALRFEASVQGYDEIWPFISKPWDMGGATALARTMGGRDVQGTRRKTRAAGRLLGYQFHVLPEFSLSGKRYKLKAAIGNGDQRIYFDEENDIMVVITAGNYNNWQTKNSLGLLKAFIYPSIFF